MSSDAPTTRPASAGEPAAGVRRIGRLEPAALFGVMSRDIAIFGRNWPSTTFSSIVQPTVYLLAFGLGLGTIIARVGNVDYVQYVATGVVATAVLFSSAFPGMFNTFIRWQFQRTYDAILAAPVDVEELVTAEVLWISLRASVYGLAPLLVGLAFGLQPEVGMLLVVPIGFVTGLRLRLLRRGDRGGGENDRQLQLHHQRRADAPVPRGRHLLPDLESEKRGAVGGGPVQPALPLRRTRPRRDLRRPRPGRPLPRRAC